MARLTIDIYSDVLQQTMTVDMFFPNDQEGYDRSEPEAVLYLLHGMKGNSSSWFERTAITRYASENNIIVISPQAHNSYYCNNSFGEEYFTFYTEELIQKLHSIFKIPKSKEKTFVAGLSMGGYGAMLLGLSRPDLFAACATFSGAIGLVEGAYVSSDDPFARRYLLPILGPQCEFRDELNIIKLAENVAKLPMEKQPRVLCTCGRQDFLYKANIEFKKQIQSLSMDFTYMEWDGIHDWNFWDRSIVYAISFFLKNDYDKECLDRWERPVSMEKSDLQTISYE